MPSIRGQTGHEVIMPFTEEYYQHSEPAGGQKTENPKN
jgi:hypothetical protein